MSLISKSARVLANHTMQKRASRAEISDSLPSGFFCHLACSGRSAVYCPCASLSPATETLEN
jgi:hypothetical protein